MVLGFGFGVLGLGFGVWVRVFGFVFGVWVQGLRFGGFEFGLMGIGRP